MDAMTDTGHHYDAHQFADFIRVLMDDVDVAGDFARMTGLPVALRAFARAVFAWIDGNVSHLRATLLAVCRDLLTTPEIVVLNEQSYELNGKAEVVARPKFTKMEDGLRFACALAGKHLAPGHRLDLGGKGWQAFKRSLQVRHRVTHPRGRQDLDISDPELDDLRETMHWSCTQLGALWAEVMRNHPDAAKSDGAGGR
jgi:hypothetical protein